MLLILQIQYVPENAITNTPHVMCWDGASLGLFNSRAIWWCSGAKSEKTKPATDTGGKPHLPSTR